MTQPPPHRPVHAALDLVGTLADTHMMPMVPETLARTATTAGRIGPNSAMQASRVRLERPAISDPATADAWWATARAQRRTTVGTRTIATTPAEISPFIGPRPRAATPDVPSVGSAERYGSPTHLRFANVREPAPAFIG